MAPSRELLEILVCPESKEPLLYFAEGDPDAGGEPFLFCPASRLAYPVRDGVPVMLIDEATRLREEEAARLAESGRASEAE